MSLLTTARFLANRSKRRPHQTDLKRAVSTAYYAMFNALAETCANMIVGGPGAQRGERAWTQVFRALNHRAAKDACNKCVSHGRIANFPVNIRNFARAFSSLQELRHEADYNPQYKVKRNEVVAIIKAAENAISDLNSVPNKHKRAFAVFVLFPRRK